MSNICLAGCRAASRRSCTACCASSSMAQAASQSVVNRFTNRARGGDTARTSSGEHMHSNPTLRRWLPAALCSALLAGGVTAAHAQQQLDPVKVNAQQCTTAAMGAPIDAKLIGEPVSAVQIDKVEWFAAADRSPAMCVVEGQLLPVDKSP